MNAVDIRLKALLLVLALVITIVLIVNFWPDEKAQQQTVVNEVSQKSKTIILFNNAVIDLRKHRFWQAIEGFRQVLKTAPTMPEAYVNIGFANLELKQYEQAKQAFNTALELRAGQINAYWGLAVSLEGLCDIPTAIGAMKTYVHLAKKNDPYLKKANAALWEWDQQKKAAELSGSNKMTCQPSSI